MSEVWKHLHILCCQGLYCFLPSHFITEQFQQQLGLPCDSVRFCEGFSSAAAASLPARSLLHSYTASCSGEFLKDPLEESRVEDGAPFLHLSLAELLQPFPQSAPSRVTMRQLLGREGGGKRHFPAVLHDPQQRKCTAEVWEFG